MQYVPNARGRWTLWVLLAGALAFLTSLYLPWIRAASSPLGNLFGRGAQGKGILPLLDLFAGDGGGASRGWTGPVAQAAALVALALAFGAVVSLLRPELETRLPLGSGAVALLFFAVVNFAQIRAIARILIGADGHLSILIAYGTVLGLASAVVVCVAATDLRWDELGRRHSVTGLTGCALTLGLLTAFLLPWLHVHVPHPAAVGATGFQFSTQGTSTAILICGFALFGLPRWLEPGRIATRLAVAVATVVLVLGGVFPIVGQTQTPYEAWVALGCSLALLLLAIAGARGRLRVGRPSVPDAAMLVAASLLVVSLFLPWQKLQCIPACLPTTGWWESVSAMSGGMALLLLVLLVSRGRFLLELIVGAAIYVMLAGFDITTLGRLDYGAPLGFACGAMLAITAVRRFRSVALRGRLVRMVPIVLCLVLLAIPILSYTGWLLPELQSYSPWGLPWLEAAAILVALRLLGRWLSGPKRDDELVLLPAMLAALVELDLGYNQSALWITWPGWLSLGLCLALIALAWIDRSGGLENFRVPEEIWRIDRLPGED